MSTPSSIQNNKTQFNNNTVLSYQPKAEPTDSIWDIAQNHGFWSGLIGSGINIFSHIKYAAAPAAPVVNAAVNAAVNGAPGAVGSPAVVKAGIFMTLSKLTYKVLSYVPEFVKKGFDIIYQVSKVTISYIPHFIPVGIGTALDIYQFNPANSPETKLANELLVDLSIGIILYNAPSGLYKYEEADFRPFKAFFTSGVIFKFAMRSTLLAASVSTSVVALDLSDKDNKFYSGSLVYYKFNDIICDSKAAISHAQSKEFSILTTITIEETLRLTTIAAFVPTFFTAKYDFQKTIADDNNKIYLKSFALGAVISFAWYSVSYKVTELLQTLATAANSFAGIIDIDVSISFNREWNTTISKTVTAMSYPALMPKVGDNFFYYSLAVFAVEQTGKMIEQNPNSLAYVLYSKIKNNNTLNTNSTGDDAKALKITIQILPQTNTSDITPEDLYTLDAAINSTLNTTDIGSIDGYNTTESNIYGQEETAGNVIDTEL